MAQTGQAGMEHWRRALRWTGAGVFAVALVGGLVGGLTRGSLAPADVGSQSRQHASTTATSPDDDAACGLGEDGGARDSGVAAPLGPPVGLDVEERRRLAHPRHPLVLGTGPLCRGPGADRPGGADQGQQPGLHQRRPGRCGGGQRLDLPSAAEAQAEYAALAGSKTAGCMNSVASSTLRKSMQTDAGSSTTVGLISFAELPAGAAALHMTGFTVSVPIAHGGRVLTVTSTQVDFVSGSLVHEMTFDGNGATFPTVLEEQLLAVAQARLETRGACDMSAHGLADGIGRRPWVGGGEPRHCGYAPGRPRRTEGMPMTPADSKSDPDRWWHGGVFYQIYPRSYADSNGDGVGDLPGIVSKLDHLARLGISGIWLSPVTCSPNRDWGYDVSDYRDIDPSFGTLDDLDDLVREAAARGIRILMDLVPNHTSDRHAWFVDALSGRDSVHRDYYVWADPKPDGGLPNNWVSIFGGPAWHFDEASGQYYLHNFEAQQPDLNWWNEEVRGEFDDIVRFWWDRGVAGFRIDVCNMMIKDKELRDNPPATEDDPLDQQFMGLRAVYNTDRPEAHDILQRWRSIADSYEPERLLIGETNVEKLPVLMDFYGDGHNELHGGFNFVFINAPLEAEALRAVVEETEALLPEERGRSGPPPTMTSRASPPVGRPAIRPR